MTGMNRLKKNSTSENLKKLTLRIKELKKITTKKIRIMSDTINHRDLAYNNIQGLDYDEMLELQAETGLSIAQMEYMYYKFNY